MEFTLITEKDELAVKRIIRTHFPLVTVLQSKPWKEGSAFKISGGMTNCVMLCKYLLCTPYLSDCYDNPSFMKYARTLDHA